MAYKVVTTVDKFNDKTTVEMNKKYKLSNGVFSHSAKICIRHLSKPGMDAIFVDYFFEDSNDICDFLYLDGREMIIRINDCENISLPFILDGEREISSIKDYNGQEHKIRTEYNFVKINKIILGKICNANSLEIKLNGQNSVEYNSGVCLGLINYCRIFYEGLYHEGLYNIESQAEKTSGKTALIIVGILLTIIGMIIISAADFGSTDSGFGVAIFLFTGIGMFVYGLVK